MKPENLLSEAEIMSEAKRLTSYESHGGLCAKMWFLPDGRVISIPVQHYEWALDHAERLRYDYGIHLSRLQHREDTPIRLHLLSKGCVRVNYEHKGGRLTVEANYGKWGKRQRDSFRLIVKKNLSDIFFVHVRLLSRSGGIVKQRNVALFNYTGRAKLKHLPLLR